MFGISFEHILIVGVILLLVGPKRLPELGNTMGKAIKNFKDSFNGIEEARFKRIEENKVAEQKAAAAAMASTQTPQTTADVAVDAAAPVKPSSHS